MPTVVIETIIDAPVELCFDLARDVGVHAESAAFSAERIVSPGLTEGLLALGDIIAFEGRYRGISYRFVARITALDRPHRFVDEMVEGAFKRLRHVHEFEFQSGITIMRDILDWKSPFGFIGRAADSLFLRRHMRWFVSTKQAALKRIAEERTNNHEIPGCRAMNLLHASNSTSQLAALDPRLLLLIVLSCYSRAEDFFHAEGKFFMKARLGQFILTAVWLLSLNTARAESIRTAVPRASLNYLSIYAAEAKGLFKDEELENETIAIGGPAAIAALLSGNVDFSGAGGSGLRAAAKGAELKAIFYQTEKVTWFFVVHPSIKSVADLKGKKIAVGLIGDSEDRFSTMFVEKNGLSAKDITRIPMGTSSGARIAAIKSGSLQAAVLDPGGMIVAEKEGLHSLAFLGDLFPLPFQGYVVTDKKIAENPGQIRRWIRAMSRALLFLRERPEEAADIGIRKLQLGNINRAMLIEATKAYTRALPPGVPGLPSREGIKNILEYEIRVPMNMAAPLPAARLLDLRFAEEVKKELEQKGLGR